MLAQVVNSATSGKFMFTFIKALDHQVHSKTLAIALAIGAALLITFLFHVFVSSVYVATTRRMFLEARTYRIVPFQRTLFFPRHRRWFKAAKTLLLSDIFYILWMFTIAGGFIKWYSYFLVPWIIAENPDISPKRAITLSRRMMYGNKWRLFVIDLSMIGWVILGGLTGGIASVLFVNPYRVAVYTEFYVKAREHAKKTGIEDSDLLNDKYLYEMASDPELDAAYPDVITHMEKTGDKVEEPRPRWLADIFGVVILNTKGEKEYEKTRDAIQEMRYYKLCHDGDTYPGRLFPVPETMRRKSLRLVHYLRHYSLPSLFLMFIIFSFAGWIWEGSIHLVNDGYFVDRGTMHGPWIPIYGTGAIMILVLLNKLRDRPFLHFIGSLVLCGSVEYFTSLILEIKFNGMHWWDYSGYFLNLNGRICAEGLLAFGVLGAFVVYVLAPLIDDLIRMISLKIVIPVTLVMVSVFMVDCVYSGKHPNMGKGVTDYGSAVRYHMCAMLSEAERTHGMPDRYGP